MTSIYNRSQFSLAILYQIKLSEVVHMSLDDTTSIEYDDIDIHRAKQVQ